MTKHKTPQPAEAAAHPFRDLLACGKKAVPKNGIFAGAKMSVFAIPKIEQTLLLASVDGVRLPLLTMDNRTGELAAILEVGGDYSLLTLTCNIADTKRAGTYVRKLLKCNFEAYAEKAKSQNGGAK